MDAEIKKTLDNFGYAASGNFENQFSQWNQKQLKLMQRSEVQTPQVIEIIAPAST